MPRPRFEKLPKERQHEIMMAAARTLADRGYEGASLNHILSEANLSKGAAYYYFDSKEDLIATMFRFLWGELTRMIAVEPDTLSPETFWPTIVAMSRQFFTLTEEKPWLMSAAKALWGLPHNLRTEAGPLKEAFDEVEGWMAMLLEHGRSLGQVRDDLPTGLLLAMVLGMDEAGDRWMLAHMDELGVKEVERIIQTIVEVWITVLSPPERRDG